MDGTRGTSRESGANKNRVDDVQRFLGERNIDRFVDRLLVETDAEQRTLLEKMLLLEETRFANATERLEMATRRIKMCEASIAKYNEILARPAHVTRSTTELLVKSLQQIHRIFVGYRDSVRRELQHL